MKYLWRLGQKTPDLSADLLKAIDYLQWAINDELNDLPATVRKYQVLMAIEKCKELLED